MMMGALAVVAAALMAWVLATKLTKGKAREEQARLETSNEALRTRLEEQESKHVRQMKELKEEHRMQMDAQKAEAERQLMMMLERQVTINERQLLQLKAQHDEQMKAYKAQVEKTSLQMLDEGRSELQKGNQQQMEAIVKPLQDNLEKMQEALQRTREDSADKSARLEEQLKAMAGKTMDLGNATMALTNAMKSNGKVQGDWGEHVLETILENSGLVKGVNYETQVNAKTESGKNYRPDVVVHCPGGMRDIVIDSKVSLSAYTNYVAAASSEEAEQYEKENYASVRRHVEELAAKGYGKLDPRNLPQVLMFVPNEGSYILALRHDPALGQWAFNKGVVILTPTNLMLTLELVCALWVNERQEKNIERILSTANTLYEKFCSFSEQMSAIRTNLKKTEDSYDSAVKYLTTGQANVVKQVDALRKLGIKYNKAKSIDAGLLEES